MKIRKVGIAKARIDGLIETNIFWLSGKDFYSTDIWLQDANWNLQKISKIDYGKSYDTALLCHFDTIRQFDSVGIHNGDEVVVLFEKANSNIIAIGKPESNKWIDVNDVFKVKVFNDFNFFISDLTVY